MNENQPDVITESELELNTKRRKQLLPWWIKIFMWLFLIFGVLAPIGLLFGILGYNFQVALYGLETSEPLSIIGIAIIIIFILKGITSYGLLKEKDWAITLAIVDGILGIIICTALMLYPVIFSEDKVTLAFRLELLFLIPYLIKMIKIKSEWESNSPISG
jgi:hypothetical protein